MLLSARNLALIAMEIAPDVFLSESAGFLAVSITGECSLQITASTELAASSA